MVHKNFNKLINNLFMNLQHTLQNSQSLLSNNINIHGICPLYFQTCKCNTNHPSKDWCYSFCEDFFRYKVVHVTLMNTPINQKNIVSNFKCRLCMPEEMETNALLYLTEHVNNEVEKLYNKNQTNNLYKLQSASMYKMIYSFLWRSKIKVTTLFSIIQNIYF